MGPGLQNWNMALAKFFKIREDIKLQFRAEAFNTFNHVNLGNPAGTRGTPSFGSISSAAAARAVQFGLKLQF